MRKKWRFAGDVSTLLGVQIPASPIYRLPKWICKSIVQFLCMHQEIKDHFNKNNEVVVNAGKGAQGIKYNGKMFCMFSKVGIMLQFPPDKVQELVEEGIGEAVSYAKNRVVISEENKGKWIELTELSLQLLKNLR